MRPAFPQKTAKAATSAFRLCAPVLTGALLLTLAQAVLIPEARALQRDGFALEVPVKLPDARALVAVDLPIEVYQASRRPGLADLRVVNGAGEVVPFALGAAPTSVAPGTRKTVRLLPFYGDAVTGNETSGDVMLSKDGDRVTLLIKPSASRQGPGQNLRAYYADLLELADAGGKQPVIQSLELTLPAGADISARLNIEASDDLKSWRALALAAPVFRLSRGDQVLSNARIELASGTARYLRITGAGEAVLTGLAEAGVQTAVSTAARPLQWLTVQGAAAQDKNGVIRNTFVYDLGMALPVARLNLLFADANTLAPVQISARNSAAQPWLEVRRETLYRMNQGKGEIRNADLELAGPPGETSQWQVHVDERAGEFGNKIPQLRVGFHAARLWFTARGEPPFSVLIGNAQADAAALAPDSLMPGGGEGIATGPLTASLDLAGAQRRAGLGPRVIDHSAEKRRQWILWGMLILGVGGLAVFAARLLKDQGKPAKPGEKV